MSVTLNQQAYQRREDATRRIEKIVADLGKSDISCNEYDNTLDTLIKEIEAARVSNQRMRSCAILRSQL